MIIGQLASNKFPEGTHKFFDVENRFYANCSKTGAPLFYLASHNDSNPRIVLHDCQKIGVVAEIFPLEVAEVIDRGLLKLHSTSASNHTWLTFCATL